MTVDMKLWSALVKEQVDSISDEEYLRDLWFGRVSGIDSPSERFNKFLSDAAVEDYVQRADTGLSIVQLESLRSLTKMMRDLCDETNEEEVQYPGHELPPEFIDDPRWQKIIKAAQKTKVLLE